MHRNCSYRKHWKRLIELYGSECYYCHEELATTIDHVVPYSWDSDNDIDNLVPACQLCNCLAHDMVFEDVNAKQSYILKKRSSRGARRNLCISCLLPFVNREHSPSAFLCPECYDREYGTKEHRRQSWQSWLSTLRAAGYFLEEHRRLAKDTEDKPYTMKQKTRMLAMLILARDDFQD